MHSDLLVSCLPHPIHLLLQRSELVSPLLKMACLLEDKVQTCWENKHGASQLALLSPQPHLLKYSLKFFLLTPQVLDSILKENILFTKVTFACLLLLPRCFYIAQSTQEISVTPPILSSSVTQFVMLSMRFLPTFMSHLPWISEHIDILMRSFKKANVFAS